MISLKKKIVGHCVGQSGEVHGPRYKRCEMVFFIGKVFVFVVHYNMLDLNT